MDTKEKRPSSGTEPRKRPSQTAGSRQPSARTPGNYKPSAPQGANIYGAGKGTGTARVTAKPRQSEVKKPEKPNMLKSIMRKGAAVSKSATASRDRVLQAQQRMQAKRKKKQERVKDTPAVIYTDPKPFNRIKLLQQLLLVAAVVVAFVLALSVFFKVETITISGADT